MGGGIASLQLQNYAKSRLTARDRRLRDDFDKTGLATRAGFVDWRLAVLSGFPAETTESVEEVAKALRGFKSWQRDRAKKPLDELSELLPKVGIQCIGFEFVPEVGPTAFIFREPADGSVAIGFDEGLREMFSVLSVAAIHASKAENLELYGLFFEHMFRLHYWDIAPVGQPKGRVWEDLLQLSDSYAGSFDGFKGMCDDMRDRAVDFIICHEAAHLECGHLSDDPSRCVKVAIGSEDGNIPVSGSHDDEFEADRRGVELLLKSSKDKRAVFTAYQMPVFAMTVLKHIEHRASAFGEVASILRKTHPPADERRARLRDQCVEIAASEGTDVESAFFLRTADFIDKFDPVAFGYA